MKKCIDIPGYPVKFLAMGLWKSLKWRNLWVSLRWQHLSLAKESWTKLNFLLTPKESQWLEHRHKKNIFSFSLPNLLVLLSFGSVKIFLLTQVIQDGTPKYSPTFLTFGYFPNPASPTFSKSLSSPCPLIPIPYSSLPATISFPWITQQFAPCS